MQTHDKQRRKYANAVVFKRTQPHAHNGKKKKHDCNVPNWKHVFVGRTAVMDLLLIAECVDMFVESGYLANTTVTSNCWLNVSFSP